MQAQHMKKDDFFGTLDKISGFLLVNLLWVGCSLLLITLPAATAGLFAVMSDWARGKESEAFARFFGAMRQQWRKSSLIALGDALILGLVVLNISLLPQMNLPLFLLYPSISIMIFVTLLTLMLNLYIWPLLAIYDLPLRTLLEISIKLVFKHLGRSFFLLLLSFATATLVFLLPLILVVIFWFSALAYLISHGAWQVIQAYDPELANLNNSDNPNQ